MPARLFRVHLINNTRFTLGLVMGDGHVHGEFTSSDWDPPAAIPPFSERAWQSESDGFMQGTNGHVVYDLSNSERLKLEWTNPWWGQTNSTWTFLIPTGSFEDRREGSSSTFSLQEVGPRPMGTHPGLVNTDGWLELIPGWLALPSPVGTIDHAWSAFLLSETDARTVPSFGPRTIVPRLIFVPSEGAPPDSWQGTWVYPAGEERSAQLRVQISESPQAKKFAMVRLRGPSYSVALNENAGVNEIAPFSLQQDGVTETLSTNLAYRGNTWPPLVLPGRALLNEATSAFASTSRDAATSTRGSVSTSTIPNQALSIFNRIEPDERATLSNLGAQLASAANGARANITVATHLASQTLKVKTLEQADALVLDYGVTLMLYSAHAEDGQPLGYNVRYIRSSSSGRILADVMLSPAQSPLR